LGNAIFLGLRNTKCSRLQKTKNLESENVSKQIIY